MNFIMMGQVNLNSSVMLESVGAALPTIRLAFLHASQKDIAIGFSVAPIAKVLTVLHVPQVTMMTQMLTGIGTALLTIRLTFLHVSQVNIATGIGDAVCASILTVLHVIQRIVVANLTIIQGKTALMCISLIIVYVFALVVAELSVGRSHLADLGAFMFIIGIPNTIYFFLPLIGSVGHAAFVSGISRMFSQVTPTVCIIIIRFLFSLV
jgi:hypothetical protein